MKADYLNPRPEPSIRDEVRYAAGPYHATAAILGAAVVGAAGSAYSAKQSNKKKTAHTDQTTTQAPYREDLYGPDIDQVLAYQRGLVQRGAPRLDSRGNVYYDPLPTGEAPGGAGAPGTPAPSGGGNLRSVSQAASGGRRPGVGVGRINARGQWVPAAGTGAGTATPAPGAGTGSGSPAAPAGPDLSTPQGIFGEVARRGLDAGNTPTQAQARNVMGNIWGASAGPGSVAGAEQTGFEGYNPVLDRLTGTLEGDVGDRVGRDLILNFLGENGRGAGGRGGGAGGSSGGVGSFARLSSPLVTHAPAATGVPDTMVPESFFGTQTRAIFDEQANDAELQAVIDAMNADTERGMFRDLAQLDAAAQGSGRFGGSTWAAQGRDARNEAAQEMAQAAAQVRVGDREARRQARLAALQGVNTRDLGLLGANVQREGIAAGERSAGAGAAESAALARRGQDLSAIGALLDNERYSLGQLGQVGSQLSGDRLAALGMVPGLEGIGLQGLQTTLGAGGGLTDLRGQDIQRQIAGQQAGIARAGLNQQLGMWNASQGQAAVNDYLRTVMGIGGMGGTSHTVGTNVQPGLGVSPTGAAAMGALGGAATGAGIYATYRGY